MNARDLVPKLAAPYRNIYQPGPAVYEGIDTPSFRHGEMHDEWIANDFTFVKCKDGKWHAFGITHPRPACFLDDFNCDGDMHEAEYQLFHAVYDGTLAELYQSGSMTDEPKILYPQSRPGETLECWAPCLVEKDGLYYLFYSPNSMRLAVSKDLYHWEVKGVVFDGPFMMRDPYIFEENGVYTMVYVSDCLHYRTSTDLLNWGEEGVFQEHKFSSRTAQESPCVFKRGDMYYLMWCVCDGQNGSYDDRTFLFQSKDLYGFVDTCPVAMYPGHAPEIVAGEDGRDYIVSVFYPENGLNMAPLQWEAI